MKKYFSHTGITLIAGIFCMFFSEKDAHAGKNGMEGWPHACPLPLYAPTIVCPANISKNTDPFVSKAIVNYEPVVTGLPAPSLNYSFSGATIGSGKGSGSGTAFRNGVTTVFITATNTEGSASCSFTVTVEDKEGPDVNCLPPVTGLGGSKEVPDPKDQIANMTATDNGEGAVTITFAGDVITGSYPCNYAIIRTFTATDKAGNATICQQSISVSDYVPPEITCPGNITVATASPASGGSVVNYTSPVGIDNSDSARTVQTSGMPSGSTFPVGTTTNTFVTNDACGNTATCSFTITVVREKIKGGPGSAAKDP